MPFTLRREGDTENPIKVRPFGEQTTGGLLAYYTKKGGNTYAVVLLGEGERIAKGQTSGEGEFEGITWMRYGGRLLQPYDAGTGSGDFIFRPGLETDRVLQFNDPIQGRMTFLPEIDTTFSGIPYVEVRLPQDLSTDTGEPTEFEIKLKTSRMQNYDANGTPLGKGFTSNPARIAVFMAKYYAAIDIAARIHWPSWVTNFRDRCDVGLGWATGAGDGLTGEYYSGASFNALVGTRIDQQIEFNWGNAAPMSGIGDQFSVRWTGKFEAKTTETFTFYLESDDAARVFINGVLVVNDWTIDEIPEKSGSISLAAGKHDITVEYRDQGGAARVFLSYSTPTVSRRIVPKELFYSSAGVATTGRTIPRFEGDIVLTGVPWPQAWQAIMDRAPGVKWQIVNGKVKFIYGPERTVVKRFTYDPTQTAVLSNIVKDSVSIQRLPPSRKPNFFVVSFRDKDTDTFDQRFIDIKRAELRSQNNGRLVNLGIFPIGVATQSLAQRIGETQMRFLSDRDTEVELKGLKDSHVIAKHDLIEIAHKLGEWKETPLAGETGPITFEILKETFESTISTANEKTFIARIWRNGDYSDTDQGPLITNNPGDIISRFTPPPLVANVVLQQGSRLLTDGTFIPTIQGFVTFNSFTYTQRGRVSWKKPGTSLFVQTDIELNPNPTVLQAPFELIGVEPGTHQIVVTTENELGISFDFAAHPVWSIITTGQNVAPSSPGTPTAVMGEDGTVVWTFTPAPEADVSYYQALDAAGTIVPGGEHLDATRFTEAPSAAVLQRRFRAVNRSGVAGPMSAIGTFVLPSPTQPAATMTYDGERLVITITNPSERVSYDYATANDGTGILAQNHGPRFEELNPPTVSRSIVRYVRAVRFGAASVWVQVSATINPPTAPTLAVDAVFPFHAVIIATPPAGLNRLLIRRTIIEISTTSNFAAIASTFALDGVAEMFEVSGRFSVTPTIYVRVRYEDGFGAGPNSAAISITFVGLLGTDIAPGTLDKTAFAASLAMPEIVTALPSLPNTRFPEKSLVVLNNAGHPDNGKLFRNVAGAWTKAVDGADIVANSIVAAAIAAGAIGATQIAAGAVRARHLLIGNFDNLLEDPGFELNGQGWTLGAGMGVAGASPGAGPHGGLRFVSAIAPNEYLMNNVFADCKVDDVFYLECWVKHTGAGAGAPLIRWYDSNKVQISETLGVNTGVIDASGFNYFKWAVTAPAPATAAYARAGFKCLGSAGWWIDDFYFRRVIGSTVIEDGAITTQKIQADSISARHLVVAALTDNLLANSSFETHTAGVLEAWLQLGATVQSFGVGQGSYVQVPNLAAVVSKLIAVTPGETIAIKYKAWRPGSGVSVTVNLNWKANRSTSSSPYIVNSNHLAPDAFTTIFNGDVTATPTDYEFTAIVPTGMFWMSVLFTCSGTTNFDDVQVKKQIGRAVIADLSVDSAKIANATITMAKVSSLISSDYVQDIAGFKLMPGGIGEFNGGITVKAVPLTEIQIRAINSIDQNGRWRGNDAGRVPVSVIINPAVSKGVILDDNTVDIIISAEISGYWIDDTANADSVNRAHVDVLNKFGEIAFSLPDVGYFGLGIVGLGAYDRKYADPAEEAIFKVIIRNRNGYSDPIYLKGGARSTTLPATKSRANCPLELTASPVSASSISLTWQFGSGVTVYRRQRGTSTWIEHATGVSSTTPYTVTGLSELTWYEFKVSAGSGNDSNIALVRTKQIGSAVPSFPAPSGLSGSPDGASPTTQINLAWTRNATDNDGVEVYKNGALLTTLAATATSFSATGLTAATAYTFKVRNKWNTGPQFSDFSNEITVATQASGSSAAAPSGLQASNTSVQDDYEATLSWTNNGAGGTISVERKTGFSGSWSTRASGLASSTTSFVDSAVIAGAHGTTYVYRVINSAVAQYSNEADVFIEPYGGDDPYCVTLDTLVLIIDDLTGNRAWRPIGELARGMTVISVNTLTGLLNKATIESVVDGFTEHLFTCVAATGESVGSSNSHPYCRKGDRYGHAVSRLNAGDPLLRLPDLESSFVVETVVDRIDVEVLATPLAVRSLKLNAMNQTFITAGLVSHNIKPLLLP